MNFLRKLLGFQDNPVVLHSNNRAVSYPELSNAQKADYNAHIAADGARMYMAAHPGKTYTPGQNGETYEGGINHTLYQSLVGKIPITQTQKPITISGPFNGQTESPDIQSVYNTPLQKTRYSRDIQNAYYR